MNDLTKWDGGGNLEPRRPSRPQKRTAKGIIEKVQLDHLEMKGDAALTASAMELVTDLDQHRRQLATSEELNMLLFNLEAGFAARAGRKVANRNSPFGF